MFKKKKPKIKFYSLIPAVTTLYPIIPSSKLKRKWVEEEKVEFEKVKSKCPFHMKDGLRSIGKCPAIATSMATGFVLTSPADFKINTIGDGVTINVTQKPCLKHAPLVDVHNEHQTEWIVDHDKMNVLSQTIKINSPWRVICSDPDIIFFVTKVQYWKESRFTQIDGILDPMIANEINCQLMWHVMDGTEVVEAGTPLAQLIPISRNLLFHPDYVVEQADQNLYQLEDEMLYAGHHRFEPDIKTKIKNMAQILKKYGY